MYTLVQSIVELRRALGDDGPRWIKLIPRRGLHRFEFQPSELIARVERPTNTVPDSEISEAMCAPGAHHPCSCSGHR